jgi:predicted enzyme related to lactoylglutathione lyase
MSHHHKINYIEIPVKDLATSKAFFSQVFAWDFVDYGPDYAAIANGGINGGIYTSDVTVSTARGSVLVVLYSEDLERSQQQVLEHGGKTVKDVFAFPGGRRFHFSDPNGNEYAIWSDK